ncbi:hypothetical protein DFH29DRAFT_879569 [Suillus ampliporus]|nr:hypothetical protein DFH29DRAFT_879569 [Suillus ampliporus]
MLQHHGSNHTAEDTSQCDIQGELYDMEAWIHQESTFGRVFPKMKTWISCEGKVLYRKNEDLYPDYIESESYSLVEPLGLTLSLQLPGKFNEIFYGIWNDSDTDLEHPISLWTALDLDNELGVHKDEPPFRLPPLIAIEHVLFQQWVEGKILLGAEVNMFTAKGDLLNTFSRGASFSEETAVNEAPEVESTTWALIHATDIDTTINIPYIIQGLI